MKHKILALLLGVVTTVGALAGCGNDPPRPSDDTQSLYIYAIERGYGNTYADALAAAFEAKNPGVEVHVEYTILADNLTNSILKGPGLNPYDLYFTNGAAASMRAAFKNKFSGYPDGLEDLTELYDTLIPGETVTMGDKMFDSFRDLSNLGTEQKPQYFGVPWTTGIMGMNYNIDIFKSVFGENYEARLPRTTDELIKVAADLKKAGKVPFVAPGQLDYMSTTMLYPWWAQYDGMENYLNFFNGLAYDEQSGSNILSHKIYEQPARLKALEVLSECVKPESGYMLETALDYNQNNFRTLQVRFLESSMGYAMYPCGDWIEQEADDARNAPFAMMKTPIISSITHRLRTIKTEAQLCAAIDYADGKTGPETVAAFDAQDVEEVRMARGMMTSTHGLGHTAIIPSYAISKDLAKRFLLYMASDEGIRIMKENVKGGFLPFEYDYADMELSPFETSVSRNIQNLTCVGEYPNSPLIYKGGISSWYSPGGHPDAMLMTKTANRRSPDQIWKMLFYTEGQFAEVIKKLDM